eukprot:scaffold8033_cov114-Isochrysis_galbana.AAC.4
MSSAHASSPLPPPPSLAAVPPRVTSFASMLTAATSFTTTPTFVPSLLFRTCESSVVLPAPRKPDKMVSGMRDKGGASPPAARPSAATSTDSTGRPPRGTRDGITSPGGQRANTATRETAIARRGHRSATRGGTRCLFLNTGRRERQLQLRTQRCEVRESEVCQIWWPSRNTQLRQVCKIRGAEEGRRAQAQTGQELL